MNIREHIIQKALAAPITHREVIEHMVCAKCKVRLDIIFESLQKEASKSLLTSLNAIEIAYLLGRKGITSSTESKLRENLAFSWKKS